VPKSLDEIFRLIRSGQFEMAEQQCRAALEDSPKDVNVLGMHGAVLLRLGRNDDARQVLEKTIALEPAFAKPHEDLGALHLRENDPERAAYCFEKSIELDASQPGAHGGLAQALAKLGRQEEANEAHSKYLELSPTANTLAEAGRLAACGQSADAEKLCQRVLSQQPESREALRLLARIANDDGRHIIAEGLLKKIVALNPDSASACQEYGRFLGEVGRFPEAIEKFEQAIQLDPRMGENYQLLADSLSVLGRTRDALSAYEDALDRDPDNPYALAGRGHILRILGRREEAISSYEQCITRHPQLGDTWWSLASMRGYRLSDEQFATVRAAFEKADLPAAAEISLRFASARCFEQQGEYDKAWGEYQRGNRLKRASVQYDPVQTEITHDAVIRFFNGDLQSGREPSETPGPAPIFILGMPRSGSTLIEQVLASHSMVEGAGELPYIIMLSRSLGGQRPDGLRYPDVLAGMTATQLDALGKSYIYHTRLHRTESSPYFTDKMPANFPHVGLIHMMLPNAKIIDARRNPLDTTVANFRQLFAKGKNQSYDLNEFAEYYLEYLRLMQHWDEVLPGCVLRMNYEDVVEDLEGQVRRLLEFCELPWEDGCLDYYSSDRPVNTASAEQVREPVYRDALQYWKHYEQHLDEVKEILAPAIQNQPG
jgi:tetratricopeptide (TPR) repeat protein